MIVPLGLCHWIFKIQKAKFVHLPSRLTQDTTKRISDINKRREQSGTVSNEMRAQQREASEKVQEISKELRELKSKIQVQPNTNIYIYFINVNAHNVNVYLFLSLWIIIAALNYYRFLWELGSFD